MNPGFSSFDYVGLFKFWEIFEPETSCFCFAMAELPWLNYLVWFTVDAGHDTNWVLNTRLSYVWLIYQEHEEADCFGLFSAFVFEPACSAYGQVGAWWVGDHDVPVLVEHIAYVTLVMVSWFIGWQEVAGPCFVAE